MKRFLPPVKEHGAEVIALAIGGSGVPVGVDERLRNCAAIAEACAREGIPLSRVFFDPLLTPQCTDPTQAVVSLETIGRMKAEFPEAKVSIGLSNMSFGLPLRRLVHATFIPLAMHAGVDAAILNPLDKKLMSSIKTAEMLLGRDRRCKKYVKAYRAEQLTF
jgi:5-methyltetrahydrofolate--homocysteine methyltransferase